ncbi:GntR family transcriptional regulator [Planosporangium flavigriseum]|uniref:GntR family transcriptional regulator n=1 Tax=Planosporangium flavigriseum TaxID=373681 RepID=UPI0019517BC4|nr:GntR family transcriptional regulator [Planosporangium flavigriseum]
MSRVPRRLLRDEAYDVLLAAIVSGDLQPGQVVRDGELAAAVGLSRTPVREALARLADEGLVESKPNAYTRVTPLDRRDCEEAFVMLRALHVLAVTQAVPRMTADDVARMRAANAAFAAALDTGDVDAALAADDDVHSVYVDAADNRTLKSTLDRLAPRIRRLERLRFSSPPGRDSVDVHERIARACAEGDADLAGRLVHDNWDTLGRLIETAFTHEPHD